ncbi:MAG: prolipoprotein diacylglyceryl transferase [Neomegalonema sp.]|nr:prolipoprotein diacylglyceryl transferase [Neomegalonema sp.]
MLPTAALILLAPLALQFPDLDPNLVTIPGFGILPDMPIRWYALSYLAGLILGAFWVYRLMKQDALWPAGKAPMAPGKVEDLLFYMVIGVVAGGRLGYVLFYQPDMIWTDPLRIPALWEGGMAFHGGALGVILAVILYSNANGIPKFQLGDAVATATPIGLFFGRLANFVNGELWGRITEQPWGMHFPQVETMARALSNAADPELRSFGVELLKTADMPRHASQLYEAATEGLLLFAVLAYLVWRTDALKRPGTCTGVFLIGYGLARGFCEFFREPDPLKSFYPLGIEITRGQLLCIPMIIAGLIFLHLARRGRLLKSA